MQSPNHLFKKKVATYVYDRKWSDDQKITLNDDGSLLLEFTSGNKYEVISFVLGFGINKSTTLFKYL